MEEGGWPPGGKRLDMKGGKKEAIGGGLWHANSKTVGRLLPQNGWSGASDETLKTEVS